MNRSKASYTSIVVAFLFTAGCQSSSHNGPRAGLNNTGLTPNTTLGGANGGSSIRGSGKLSKGIEANSDIDVGDLDPNTVNPPIASHTITPTQQIVTSEEDEGVNVDTRPRTQNIQDGPEGEQEVAANPNSRGIYGIRGSNGINTFFGTPQEIQNALASGEAHVPGVVDNRPGHHKVAAAAPSEEVSTNLVTAPSNPANADVATVINNSTPTTVEPSANPPVEPASQEQSENLQTIPSSTPSSFTPETTPAARPAGFAPPMLADDATWKPGLPRSPLKADEQKAMWTNKLDAKNEPFTDMKSDKMMYHLRSKVESLDASIKKASDSLAQMIGDVKIEQKADGSLNLKLRFDVPSKKAIEVNLAGHPMKEDSRAYDLKEISAATGNYYFGATVKCVDAAKNKVCGNEVVYVHRYAKQQDAKLDKKSKTASVAKTDKKVASAFLVYRQSPVRMTLGQEDIHNDNHKLFSDYLHASFFNTCLLQKRSAKGEIKAAFEAECAGETPKANGAAHISLRSWAVANGRAAFELDFLDAKRDMNTALTFKGESIVSQQGQTLFMVDRTNYSFSSAIPQTTLNAQDAAGNLNVSLQFSGSPNEETRFSVTALGASTLTPPEAGAKVQTAKAKSAKPKTNAAASKKAKVASK